MSSNVNAREATNRRRIDTLLRTKKPDELIEKAEYGEDLLALTQILQAHREHVEQWLTRLDHTRQQRDDSNSPETASETERYHRISQSKFELTKYIHDAEMKALGLGCMVIDHKIMEGRNGCWKQPTWCRDA